MSEFKYPVIAFAKSGIVHFARNSDDLVVCSRRGWKNGFYSGLNIIDCEGNAYWVQEAKKVGNVGFLWGFDFALGQRIRVELIYKYVEKISIDELKEKVQKQLNKDRHFWNSGGNLEEIIATVSSSRYPSEVIESLTDLFYKNA